VSSTETTVASIAVGAGAALSKQPKARVALAVGSAILALVALRQRSAEADPGRGAVGLGSRLLFGGKPEGTITSSSTPVPSDLPTQHYTNTQRLRGKILSPTEGGTAERNLFSDTYPIELVLSNDGNAAVTDRVRVQVYEDGYFGDSSRVVTTDPVTLLPGESRQLTIEVPGLRSGILKADTTATVRFKGFKMASVNYYRA